MIQSLADLELDIGRLEIRLALPGCRRHVTARVHRGDCERTEYEALVAEMEDHFSTRFCVEGRIQIYFQFCEASKGIMDLYTGHGS